MVRFKENNRCIIRLGLLNLIIMDFKVHGELSVVFVRSC